MGIVVFFIFDTYRIWPNGFDFEFDLNYDHAVNESSMDEPRRIGIFGGTFDPIHYGHLMVASEAALKCGLDEVMFVPSGDPWQKAGTNVSPASQRLDMVRLATKSDPRFKVSTVDIERSGPTYALDTVADIRDEYAAQQASKNRKSVELSFIIGADSLEKLHTWHQVEELCAAVEFIVFNRPGSSRSTTKIPASASYELVDMPGIDISSSQCRSRMAAFKSSSSPSSSSQIPATTLRYLTPDVVCEYIAAHHLYEADLPGILGQRTPNSIHSF